MPSYSWSVDAPAASPYGRVAAAVPFCRRIDPLTGDVLFDSARAGWAVSGSPEAETIALCLRTPEGSAARDPSYGLDVTAWENARENAAADARRAIERALSRYVAAGRITVTRLEVEAQPPAMVFELDFKDRRGLSGRVAGAV